MKPRPDHVQFARKLRSQSTILERSVWSRLRAHRLDGFHWRRQRPVGPYFADFYCEKAKLVLEIDGISHRERFEHDQERDAYMRSVGLRVLRIDSNSFAKEFDHCMGRILRIVHGEEDV